MSETIYEAAKKKGMSRRDFMKLCTAVGAIMGIDFASTDKVVHAMETKEKLPVLWLNFQECTGCTESFIRADHPTAGEILLDMISLEYQDTLIAPAGHAAEAAKKAMMEKYHGRYILAVEGAVPTDREFCCIGGESALDQLREAAEGAKAVIAWGSCAAWGGIQAAKPNPTNAIPIDRVISSKPILKVPGCPPIPDVMAGVLAHIITFDELPEVDHLGRVKAFYGQRIHDNCNRRAYFDAGLFVESFDDEGAKKGYCLYKVGCKGPTTYNSCANMRWNGGTSYPIQSGNPCIGCAEKDFWDNDHFFERTARIPGTQTTVSPDKIGLGVTAAALVGVAGHAAITAGFKKHDEKKAEEQEK